MQDSFRIGSFVHIRLPKQDEETTTIARLDYADDGELALTLFFPLFPDKELTCHPPPPEHAIDPIVDGIGKNNVELYRSGIQIKQFPSFILLLYSTSKNCRIPKMHGPPESGMRNVYVVRFKQRRIQHVPKLVPIQPSDVLCFPTNSIAPDDESLIICHRCYHKNVWTGLYLLRKAISKVLNRRRRVSEKHQVVQTCGIGLIPLEVFNYIHVLANSSVKSLTCHYCSSSESYLHIDENLTRRKLKFEFEQGVMRFVSCDDLDILRQFLGLGGVYGSPETRPTLAESKHGHTLKRGHSLTLVQASKQDDETPFKRRSKQQRVDLMFSPTQVRVTVAYSRYTFDTFRSTGRLKHDPPTPHLQAILSKQKYNERPDTVFCPKRNSSPGHSSSSGGPSEISGGPDSLDASDKDRKPPANDDTFHKILEMSMNDSEDDEDDSVHDPHVATTIPPDTCSDKTDNNDSKEALDYTTNQNETASQELVLSPIDEHVKVQVGDTTIYVSDQFYDLKSVFEVSFILKPSSDKRFLVREKTTGAWFTTTKAASFVSHRPRFGPKYNHEGTLPADAGPFYVCQVVAGSMYRKEIDVSQQTIIIKEHSDEFVTKLQDFN